MAASLTKTIVTTTFVVAAILAFTLTPLATADGKPSTSPDHGVVIETKSAWTLDDQRLRNTLSPDLLRGTAPLDTLYAECPIANDLWTAQLVYLAFSARSLDDELAGQLVVCYGVEPDPRDNVSGVLEFRTPRLASRETPRGPASFLTLEVQGQGFVAAELLYSRRPELVTGWSFPEGHEKPLPVMRYDADRLPVVPRFRQRLTGTWTQFTVPIPQLAMQQMRLIDSAQAVYASLADTFASGSADPRGLWDTTRLLGDRETQVTDRAIQEAKGHRVQVTFKHDRGSALQIGTPNFPPQVRRIVAVRHLDGRIAKGEVLVQVQP